MALLARSKIVWIAGLAVVVVAVGSVGIYLHFQAKPSPSPVKAAKVASVGATTVTKSSAVEVLTVVSTAPGDRAFGQNVLTPITIRFNLPVDPSAMSSYFSVLPLVNGTFAQGTAPEDAVFTPATAFAAGASINVVLRKGFPSRSGVALQSDFGFSFNTEVSSRDVAFVANNQLARVFGAASGQSVSIQPQFGDQVPSDVKVDMFKASAADVLAAQVHDASGNYLDHPIDHHLMPQISEQPIANNQTFTVAQKDGLYLLLAADLNGQYGAMWIDFSHLGVVVRQDDQKVVVGGEDLSTGDTTPTFNITFYSLLGGVQSVAGGSFSGTGEFKVPYGTPVDVAVASSGGEDVIVPLQVPQTAADIKVVGDLSTTPQVFITTDRAGYQSGEVVKFGGIVRASNDQAYSIPTGMSVTVWAQGDSGSQVVPVAADGTFSGSLPMPSGAFNPDGSDGQLTIFAGTAAQRQVNYSPFFTAVAALGAHTPTAKVTVTLDKATYVAGDTIHASIAAVDGSGKPLASKPVNLTVYATAHPTRPSEVATFAAPSTWGAPVVQNVSATLDAGGHAAYSFKANVGGQAADEELTLAVTYGSGAAQAVGARTAVVYQAADEVFILPSRTAYMPGDTVVAPFVVETTSGQRVGGASISFELDKTDYQGSTATTTVVASGSAVADAHGLGVVRATYSGPAQSLTLRMKGQDAAGNVFVAALQIAEAGDARSLSLFGQSDALTQLTVIMDKIAYSAGDTAQLTVTAPAATTALMSAERGRIHSYRWIQLSAGDNSVALPISPDLSPGFTLTFSYFRNGIYFAEGVPISVETSPRVLRVTAVADQTSYAKGQIAHVTVTVTDAAGAPVAATLMADGYDAYMSAYKLVDKPSLPGAFLVPAARGTNGSSSLLAIGSWGGRCGGGGNPLQPPITNAGRTAVWLPDIATDAAGRATVDVPVSSGTVRLALIASTSATMLGQVQVDLSVH